MLDGTLAITAHPTQGILEGWETGGVSEELREVNGGHIITNDRTGSVQHDAHELAHMDLPTAVALLLTIRSNRDIASVRTLRRTWPVSGALGRRHNARHAILPMRYGNCRHCTALIG